MIRLGMLMLLLSAFSTINSAEAATPVTLLSVVGAARTEGKPLAAPNISLPRGATVEVGFESVAQFLIDDRLTVSLVGPAEAEFLGGKADVELRRGDIIRFSGDAGSVIIAGWRLEIPSGGATVLFDRFRVYVLEGKCVVHEPSIASLTSTNIWLQLITSPRDGDGNVVINQEAKIVAAGELAELGLDGKVRQRPGKPDADLAHRSSLYAGPNSWIPAPYRVSVVEIRQAQQWRKQQQTERETASCGCTESSGQNSGLTTGSNQSSNPIEKQFTRVQIRVTGLPRKSQ